MGSEVASFRTAGEGTGFGMVKASRRPSLMASAATFQFRFSSRTLMPASPTMVRVMKCVLLPRRAKLTRLPFRSATFFMPESFRTAMWNCETVPGPSPHWFL